MPISPRHLRSDAERAMLKASNGHVDPYAYGQGWADACNVAGLDPLTASADDVLTPCADGTMWDANGARVLLPGDTALFEDMPAYDEIEFAPEMINAFTWDVANVAALTEAETMIVQAIVDGVGSERGYANVLSERFEISPSTVRVLWSRARQKLCDAWAA